MPICSETAGAGEGKLAEECVESVERRYQAIPRCLVLTRGVKLLGLDIAQPLSIHRIHRTPPQIVVTGCNEGSLMGGKPTRFDQLLDQYCRILPLLLKASVRAAVFAPNDISCDEQQVDRTILLHLFTYGCEHPIDDQLLVILDVWAADVDVCGVKNSQFSVCLVSYRDVSCK